MRAAQEPQRSLRIQRILNLSGGGRSTLIGRSKVKTKLKTQQNVEVAKRFGEYEMLNDDEEVGDDRHEMDEDQQSDGDDNGATLSAALIRSRSEHHVRQLLALKRKTGITLINRVAKEFGIRVEILPEDSPSPTPRATESPKPKITGGLHSDQPDHNKGGLAHIENGGKGRIIRINREKTPAQEPAKPSATPEPALRRVINLKPGSPGDDPGQSQKIFVRVGTQSQQRVSSGGDRPRGKGVFGAAISALADEGR
eukprot:c2450_g1_i2.p1 GENE.c2450_g1_i2~~c2450_g1_i2.p1  ORF type:complete len:254 (-),score=45.79 c2450_g1_i2:135-896(-)